MPPSAKSQSKPPAVSAEQLGAAAALVGLLMVVAAIIWPAVNDSRGQWTDEKAKVYQEKVARAHEGTYLEAEARGGSRHGRQPVDPERLLEHREDVKALGKLKAELEIARQRPSRIAGILKWSGVGLVVIGVVVLLAGRSRSG